MLTQKDHIIKHIEKYGSITPARMGGKMLNEIIFPACGMRRCQEMEKDGLLTSYRDGQFKTFILKKELPNLFDKETARSGQVLVNNQWYNIK